MTAADHARAVKAVRLPRSTLSTMDSPNLSLISLAKSWPQQKVRREVLMVTDRIDRLKGEAPDPWACEADLESSHWRGFTTTERSVSMPTGGLISSEKMLLDNRVVPGDGIGPNACQ
jgi:hypothetical protein